MEYSCRMNFVITRLSVAIADFVENLISQGFDQWQDNQLMIDNELNLSYMYAEEVIQKDMFDVDLILRNFVEIFNEDDEPLIGANLESCDKLADKYAPLVEFGLIQTSKWHKEWSSFPNN